MKKQGEEAPREAVPQSGSLGLLAQGWRGTLAWRKARDGGEKEQTDA